MISENPQNDALRDAWIKQDRGDQLTQREQRAIARWNREREEQDRWRFYRSVPKGHYSKLSGRQSRTLNEQAERYGLPFGGKIIDLAEVIKCFHDFLAKYGSRLLSADDDLMASTAVSPALEAYRKERAKLARMDRLERERTLVARADVHAGMIRFASVIRNAGDLLEKEFGADARSILNEALNDATADVERSFADDGKDTEDDESH